MPRDPRVDKLQRLRTERTTRAAGGYYNTRATPYGNVQGGPRRRNVGRTLLSLLVFVAIVVGGLFYATQWAFHGGIKPAAASTAKPRAVTFVVAPGESTSHIADRLQADGVVFNSTFFHWYMRLTGIGGNIQAGPHTLNTNMSMDQVVQALSSTPPAAPTTTVRILPGWRAEQVAAALDKHGVASYASVMNEIKQGTFNFPFLAGRPVGASLEGYLLPDDYIFRLHGGAHYAIDRILSNFGQRVTPTIQARGKKVYGSFYNAVIMASIVERESGAPQDDALIADVFLNRLHDTSGGFTHLNADATLQYAVGKAPDWWAPQNDTTIKSPYNTYTHTGLPPTPISNPALATIIATVNPAHTNFFYYWHKNGSHGLSIFCSADQGANCAGTPQ